MNPFNKIRELFQRRAREAAARAELNALQDLYAAEREQRIARAAHGMTWGEATRIKDQSDRATHGAPRVQGLDILESAAAERVLDAGRDAAISRTQPPPTAARSGVTDTELDDAAQRLEQRRVEEADAEREFWRVFDQPMAEASRDEQEPREHGADMCTAEENLAEATLAREEAAHHLTRVTRTATSSSAEDTHSGGDAASDADTTHTDAQRETAQDLAGRDPESRTLHPGGDGARILAKHRIVNDQVVIEYCDCDGWIVGRSARPLCEGETADSVREHFLDTLPPHATRPNFGPSITPAHQASLDRHHPATHQERITRHRERERAAREELARLWERAATTGDQVSMAEWAQAQTRAMNAARAQVAAEDAARASQDTSGRDQVPAPDQPRGGGSRGVEVTRGEGLPLSWLHVHEPQSELSPQRRGEMDQIDAKLQGRHQRIRHTQTGTVKDPATAAGEFATAVGDQVARQHLRSSMGVEFVPHPDAQAGEPGAGAPVDVDRSGPALEFGFVAPSPSADNRAQGMEAALGSARDAVNQLHVHRVTAAHTESAQDRARHTNRWAADAGTDAGTGERSTEHSVEHGVEHGDNHLGQSARPGG